MLKKLVPETFAKNLTQVHHSFLHQNNSPANHVARFVSRAGQFLCWNRAVLNCVWETCNRNNLYQIDTCTFLVPDDWYKLLEQISWMCVAGIIPQEHWSCLHSVDCRSTEWRFERLSSSFNIWVGSSGLDSAFFVLTTIFTMSELKLAS